MNKKRKAWRWGILILALAVLAGVWFFGSYSQRTGAGYTEETARTGSLETYYSFSGNVAVKNSQVLTTKTSAVIRDLYVEVDQTVQEGEALVRLSNGDVLRAEISGEVTQLPVSVGDTVSAGTQLMTIIDFTQLQVLAKVDEFDVLAVSADMEASVTIDALGLSYIGIVEHISKQAQTTGDISYYEAKITAPMGEHILPGMKVDVRVLNAQVENATLLSMKALQFDEYNQPYVYVRNTSGDVVKREVTVGIQDGTTAQITSALSAGETVLIPDDNSMLFPMMSLRSR